MKGAAQAGLGVAQKGVDPEELWQVVGVLAAGDHCLVVAVGCGHSAEADQAMGEHMAAVHQMAFSPVSDCL